MIDYVSGLKMIRSIAENYLEIEESRLRVERLEALKVVNTKSISYLSRLHAARVVG